MQGQDEQGFESVAARGCQEGACLLRCKRANLLLLWPRSFDSLGDVPPYEAVALCLLQGPVQRHVYVLHRTRRSTPVEPGAVEGADLGGVEGLELRPA